MNEINPMPASESQESAESADDVEKEIDLNVLFPEERNDLNQLFPDVEMKELLKKVSKNKKDLHLMVDRFTEIAEPD